LTLADLLRYIWYGGMAGMAVCAAVIAVLSAVLYGVYRITRRSVCRALGIQGK